VSSEDELESRTCPVCRRKMKLARVGGHPKVSTYQCLSCKEVMTVEDWTGSGSYFQGAALFVGRAGEQHWVPAIRVFRARWLHSASGQDENIRARRGQKICPASPSITQRALTFTVVAYFSTMPPNTPS